MSRIDLIAPLQRLKHRAEGLHESDFRNGYLMAIGHAIELAEVQQTRIDVQLAGAPEASDHAINQWEDADYIGGRTI